MAFDWLKRKKKAAPRPKRRLPQRRLAPVEEIVEQGLMVADVAVRMGVSRQTIGNILHGARRKVADALVNGKALRIGSRETGSADARDEQERGSLS